MCADLDGFSLHAAVRVRQGRPHRLEHLIRYVARPPIAEDRLSILPDGRVAYAFKKRWRDGSMSVVLDPLTFLERLAALVPRPRKKPVNYFGVFAPAAAWRPRVVPTPRRADAADTAATAPPRCAHQSADLPPAHRPRAEATVQSTAEPQPDKNSSPSPTRPNFHGIPHAPRKQPRRRRYYFWAELLKRVFTRRSNCILPSRSDWIRPRDASVPSSVPAGTRLRPPPEPLGW
ncbi:MAG: transposase [Planctomycetes bacterium]|nr:transposase [Planctomycetota bacterium]